MHASQRSQWRIQNGRQNEPGLQKQHGPAKSKSVSALHRTPSGQACTALVAGQRTPSKLPESSSRPRYSNSTNPLQARTETKLPVAYPSHPMTSTSSSTTTNDVANREDSPRFATPDLRQQRNYERETAARSQTSAQSGHSSLQVAPRNRLPLRRKASTIEQYSRRARTEPESMQEHQELVDVAHDLYHDPFPGSVLGISLPPTYSAMKSRPASTLRDSTQRPPRIATKAPQEITHRHSTVRAPSTTPSTRCTDSPFSQFSAPTSMSSYSPQTARSGYSPATARPAKDDGQRTVRERPKIEENVEIPPSTVARLDRKGPSLPSSPRAFRNSALGIQPVKTGRANHSLDMTTKIDEPLSPRSKPSPLAVPPEFAHLNIDQAQRPARSAPRRPSRDGTPDLSDLQGSFPVIQSQLPHFYTSYHKRLPSLERPNPVIFPASPQSRGRFGFSSRSSSREPVSRTNSAVPPSPSSISQIKSPVSDAGSASNIYRYDSPMIAPSPSPSSSSRFGRFLRRDKEPTVRPAPSERKLRKGPAAGTGYERYGKFGLRGRSSNISQPTEKRAGSADSTASTGSRFWRKRSTTPASEDESDLDDFFKDRLSPITLRGSRGSSADVASLNSTAPSSATYAASNADKRLSQRQSHDSSMPLADVEGFVKAGLIDSNPAQDHGAAANTQKPADKAVRKSQTLGDLPEHSQTIRSFEHSRGVKLPSNNNFIRGAVGLPHPTYRTVVSVGDGDEAPTKSRDKGPKSTSRWNLFQRAAGARSTRTSSRGDREKDNKPLFDTRTGPWMLDLDVHNVDLEELDRSLSRDSFVASKPADRSSSTVPPISVVPYQKRHEYLMPPPARLTNEIKSGPQRLPARISMERTDSAESPELLKADLARTSDPPQVVSIPRSTRPSTPSAVHPALRSPVKDGLPRALNSARASNHATSNDMPRMSVGRPDTEEFIAWPPRKNSELSYTSSSGAASFRTASTLMPTTSGPVQWLGDEDKWIEYGEEHIWNEYNDLLDQVNPEPVMKAMARSKTPPSAGSSFGAPFQYDESNAPLVKPLPQIPDVVENAVSITTSDDEQIPDTPYRFSRFLQPATTPTTPYSISDIMAGYSDAAPSGRSSTVRQSVGPISRASVGSGYSSHYSRTSGPSRITSRYKDGMSEVPEVPSLETTPVLDLEASRNEEQKRASLRKSADADLRFGALMTSKWLSFGRVLFSPAHEEVTKGGDGVRILIVDGLGKDWSYYCALTYPNATFYNLEIGGNSRKASNRAKDLANYRNVTHTSLSSPFPFPRGFFSTVVFRFPIATTEKAYQAATFECKRVLRAGGYLELSVLDLDLMNMGSNMRRALRSLKLDINEAQPQASLRNLGDTMMTLIGRRGYENVQRCVVGIPAAGPIRRSTDLSSSGSERDSNGIPVKPPRPGFAELLHTTPNGNAKTTKKNDEGISKMVARVGRWWYSTCYESLASKDGSLWEDPGVLRECERKGTAFRLLLCCARKPECPKRRTASI